MPRKTLLRRTLSSLFTILFALAILFVWRQMETSAPAESSPKTSDKKRSPKKKTKASRPSSPATANGTNREVQRLFQAKQSDTFVTVTAQVKKLLPDDNKGSRHQRFIIEVAPGHTVLVAHNIDLATPVPLKAGDSVTLRGEYEWNDRGGVLHFTHRPSRGSGQGGHIVHRGKRYD